METVLICPGERPAVSFLAEAGPLVVLPVLGQSVLAWWIEFLASKRQKDIVVLATDRPEAVRAEIGDGSRWGVRVQVQRELRELTVEQVAARQGESVTCARKEVGSGVVLLDHLPGFEQQPLFQSYRTWFAANMGWMARPAAQNSMGMRQIQPGIWCGRRARISARAILKGPCWLGHHVHIGPDAVIGPNAILEDRVVIDKAAEVQSSLVGPETFVGALTRLENSIAWGSTLIDWRSSSCTQVPDPFLLCSLGKHISLRNRSIAAWLRTGLSEVFYRPFEVLAALPDRFRNR